MIIHDSHTHIFPDKIAEKATKSIGNFYELEMYSPATAKRLNESDGKIHVGLKLVCSSAVTPEQVDGINAFITGEYLKNPSYIGFAALHPYTDNYSEVLDFAEQNNLRGVKFHSDFQKINLDDERAYPMYREIAKRGLPVLFHMGDPRYDYSSPKRLKRLMYDIPDLKVIAAHFGGYRRWDEAIELDKSEKLYFDTSSALAFMDKDDVYGFFDKFGTDKFFFGTDFPMWNAEDELKRFLSLGLGKEDNEKILHKNFEGFFGISYEE